MNKSVKGKKLPLYKEIPDLDLYLDQVLLYINSFIESDDGNQAITPSMINNYVKLGFLKKPIKKKYRRNQLARLISISLLKNVFSINDISKALDNLEVTYPSSDLYDFFVISMNDELSENAPEIITNACKTLKLYYMTMESLNEMEVEKYENQL